MWIENDWFYIKIKIAHINMDSKDMQWFKSCLEAILEASSEQKHKDVVFFQMKAEDLPETLLIIYK